MNDLGIKDDGNECEKKLLHKFFRVVSEVSIFVGNPVLQAFLLGKPLPAVSSACMRSAQLPN